MPFSSNLENSAEYIWYIKTPEYVKLWLLRPLWENLIYLMDSSGADTIEMP